MGLNITIGGLNIHQWEFIIELCEYGKDSIECTETEKILCESILNVAKDNQAELEKELREFQ